MLEFHESRMYRKDKWDKSRDIYDENPEASDALMQSVLLDHTPAGPGLA